LDIFLIRVRPRPAADYVLTSVRGTDGVEIVDLFPLRKRG
jgi:hypothetical protein